ncbi:MAG TPA: 1-deoxy-D-xylulose-5-phosphate synthase [Pirellulaceae bacterium]|nr:1-deoxy-D-xylulose-5-phosphate synthase [Pirellulaceae bacterium]HMO90652.1 1-deoxy-D-xylulose-5-phosphate synthase [Pirellulaceae bacterium]HMP67769.1 1-deoxy-D-xylulose-5-phosphate synthase [Pirellulaceae bacterium]
MIQTLPTIQSPLQLHKLSVSELEKLADEIREVLCGLLNSRSAHFASNLGVVELTLALHSVFDFSRDRLIWDTGHQIYPHKLVTGRFHQFETIRMRGGLMGYPNPLESDYDLFMTGHAGCSVSTMVGLRSGDLLNNEPDRKAVAVIGDGALPSGIVFEAFNNAAELESDLLVVLNDNEMSICPRVGGLATYLDRLRSNPIYSGLKTEVVNILNKVPLFGDPAERFLQQIKEGVKAGMHGGMLFEEMGFRYFGPIDGHDIRILKKYFAMLKDQKGPVLLHVLTRKGHGFKPAAEDPVYFHTPPAFERCGDKAVPKSKGGLKAYTNHAADSIMDQMTHNPKVTVITAAMCQGNKLEAVRESFPDRFFDVGICESHAVAFAAGQAKTGIRPIVDIYSTFLQRSFDQVFQEVCLQNLPVVFMMDRAGLTANDGPTHHGTFDFGYMRILPNMVVMAPGDANDLGAMLDFALQHDSPTAIRYPKDDAAEIRRSLQPVELGHAEVLSHGEHGTIICAGTQLHACLAASAQLKEDGIDVGVINARFVKPLDKKTLSEAIRTSSFIVTVEEAMLMGGFGSALLEMANEMQLRTDHIKRLGIDDRFVEHGDRHELLATLGIDQAGIVETVRQMVKIHSEFEDSQIYK